MCKCLKHEKEITEFNRNNVFIKYVFLLRELSKEEEEKLLEIQRKYAKKYAKKILCEAKPVSENELYQHVSELMTVLSMYSNNIMANSSIATTLAMSLLYDFVIVRYGKDIMKFVMDSVHETLKAVFNNVALALFGETLEEENDTNGNNTSEVFM